VVLGVVVALVLAIAYNTFTKSCVLAAGCDG
jgi:hypothetical protein